MRFIVLLLIIVMSFQAEVTVAQNKGDLLALKSKTQSKVVFEKTTHEIGKFIDVLYSGEWRSTQDDQIGFLNGNKGMILLAFALQRKKDQKLYFAFEFFESHYVEDPFLLSDVELEISHEEKGVIRGEGVNATVIKNSKIFYENGVDKCNLSVELNLMNQLSLPIDIDSQDLLAITIKGRIKSDNCSLDIEFAVEPDFIETGSVLMFMILQIAAVICGFFPLYQALRNQDLSLISNISDFTFLGNIVIDLAFLTINITIGMRILPSYFELLTLITMFQMVGLLFKMRFYMHLFEMRTYANNFDIERISKLKFYFLIKLIVIGASTILLSDFLIIYYMLFIPLFLYPLAQIYHNSCSVIRKNCFKNELHPALMLPQILYPLGLRSLNFSFLQLRQDYKFGLIITAIITSQLVLMYMQKKLGPSFFLPKFLRPNYFDYDKKIDTLSCPETENCPICFLLLSEAPDNEKGIKDKLVPTIYMETPCEHKFHEKCLKVWMEQKLVCPCCRTKLPPY